jgi:alpha-tubulin suppressor-like RCC1 family protein
MPNGVPFVTNFRDSNGVDLGNQFVEKDYLIDVYPNLVPQQKASTLWNWGSISCGALTPGVSSPVQTFSSGTNWNTSANADRSAAGIKTDGTLWIWGNGAYGLLGNNLRTAFSSPVQTVSGGTNWKQVAVAYRHTSSVKTDGTLWIWGANSYGQLGTNNRVNQSSPVQTISGGTNWKQVELGFSFSSAIKTDGTLWFWGCGNCGTFGTNVGGVVRQSSPVQTISGGTNWKQVSVYSAVVGAVKTDGTLWMWGSGSGGILGDNTTISKSSPVQTIGGGTNWKQVSASNYAGAGIKTDGTLWMWGNPSATISYLATTSSPVQTFVGGRNWKCVKSSSTTITLKTDGTMWLWGRPSYGRLGNNCAYNIPNQSPSSPVQTVAGGTNWKSFAVGSISGQHMAIKEEGDW